jgi:hypothetical protein
MWKALIAGTAASVITGSSLLFAQQPQPQPQRSLPKRSMTKTMIGRLQNIIKTAIGGRQENMIKTMIGGRLENMTKTVGSHLRMI